MQAVLNNVSTSSVGKPGIITKLEEGQQYIPETLRLVAAIIQESLAELVSPLLMVGLILSMSNFLLNGAVFSFNVAIPIIWVVVQSVAVDANLGVMVVRGVNNFHKGEIAKGAIYLAIALALLFVAAIITDVEAVRSILNRNLDLIFAHLNVSIEVLTFVRSSAVVALVAATQLEHVSLRRSKVSAAPAVAPAPSQMPQSEQSVSLGDHHFINEAEALRYLHTYAEERADQYRLGTGGNTDELSIVNAPGMHRDIVISDEQHQRLYRSWKKLSAQGYSVSINQLQKSAGIRREVAAHWLRNQRYKRELWNAEVPCTPGVNEESEAMA